MFARAPLRSEAAAHMPLSAQVLLLLRLAWLRRRAEGSGIAVVRSRTPRQKLEITERIADSESTYLSMNAE